MADVHADPSCERLGLTPGERGAFLESAIGRGLGPRDLARMLDDGYARPATWAAGSLAARADEPQRHFAVVLSGGLEVARAQADGSRQILDLIGPGQVCGAVTACAPRPRWPADVQVTEPSRVLVIEPAAFLAPEAVEACAADPTRVRLLQNLTRILAGRARHLNQRMQLVTVRSLRGKIAAYLLTLPREAGPAGGAFVVRLPGTRQQMADTLLASRASMTREMGRMADEGLIAPRGRLITVLDPAGVTRAAGS